MNLKNLLIGLVGLNLLCALPVWADDWTPHVKDEFDIDYQAQADADAAKPVPDEKPAPAPKIEKATPEKTLESKSVPVAPVAAKTYKNLKSTPVHLQDGTEAKFDKIVIFSCTDIPKKRFLFNKKQTDYCWIKDVKDAGKIAEKVGLDNFKSKSAVFDMCPEKATSQKACNPKSVRNF